MTTADFVQKSGTATALPCSTLGFPKKNYKYFSKSGAVNPMYYFISCEKSK
jgi:hypothetical protein